MSVVDFRELVRAEQAAAEPVVPHAGMPPLKQDGAPLSFFEFWPMGLFYAPIALYAGWLMLRHRGITLPTAANPSFPGGGFYGESKSAILDLAIAAAPDNVAPFVTHDRPEEEGEPVQEFMAVVDRMLAAGLCLPLVAKPDLGCRGAGVRLVRDGAELLAYIDSFPLGARMILQRLADFEGEAGIFYVRRPGEVRGRLLSLTLKYFPRVVGDGVSTLRQLIMADPRAGLVPQLYLTRHAARLDQVVPAGEAVRLTFSGSHSKGAIFRDGTHLITPQMESAFDRIAQAMPDFHFGRFDVRFPDFGRLQAGHDFTIVEVNGAGAEMTHVWDRKTGLLAAWGCLMRQYRLLWQIGAANRDRGHRPLTLQAFRAMHRREKELTSRYPVTM